MSDPRSSATVDRASGHPYSRFGVTSRRRPGGRSPLCHSRLDRARVDADRLPARQRLRPSASDATDHPQRRCLEDARARGQRRLSLGRPLRSLRRFGHGVDRQRHAHRLVLHLVRVATPHSGSGTIGPIRLARSYNASPPAGVHRPNYGFALLAFVRDRLRKLRGTPSVDTARNPQSARYAPRPAPPTMAE